ncbi:SDR family oxidoreductase [bacterium]|nr:SDR family oxidoreductase [bacterium]
MKKILITGGSGLVGGTAVNHARGKWDVYTTTHQHPFSLPGVHVLSLNLTEPDEIRRIIKAISPDVVIHCAALSDLDDCEKKPDLCFRINARATEIIAKLCSEISCRLIYISTDMVFDGRRGRYCESDKTRPINLYGKAKLEGEESVKAFCQNHVIARSALDYGRPVMKGNSFSEKILNRIQNGETVTLFKDQFRTPIWVENLSRALLELAELTFIGTIHLGGRDRVDRYTFGLKLAELKNLSKTLIVPARMKDVQTGAPRPLDVSFDTSKAQHLLKTELLGYREGLRHI